MTVGSCSVAISRSRPPGVRARQHRATLDRILLRELAIPKAVQSRRVRIDGEASRLVELLGLFDEFTLMFEMVEPKLSA